MNHSLECMSNLLISSNQSFLVFLDRLLSFLLMKYALEFHYFGHWTRYRPGTILGTCYCFKCKFQYLDLERLLSEGEQLFNMETNDILQIHIKIKRGDWKSSWGDNLDILNTQSETLIWDGIVSVNSDG